MRVIITIIIEWIRCRGEERLVGFFHVIMNYCCRVQVRIRNRNRNVKLGLGIEIEMLPSYIGNLTRLRMCVYICPIPCQTMPFTVQKTFKFISLHNRS